MYWLLHSNKWGLMDSSKSQKSFSSATQIVQDGNQSMCLLCTSTLWMLQPAWYLLREVIIMYHLWSHSDACIMKQHRKMMEDSSLETSAIDELSFCVCRNCVGCLRATCLFRYDGIQLDLPNMDAIRIIPLASCKTPWPL